MARTSAAAAEAEGRHGRRRGTGHGRDPLVVGVEDGEAVGRQSGGQLALRARDRLDAAGAHEVHWLDVEDDPDLRARDLGQPRDLALGVHAHLEHRHAVRIGQAQEGQRQAGLRIEVALVPQDRLGPRQHVRHDLLGEGLPGRAGDPDHADRVAATPPSGKVAERHERIGNLHQRGVAAGRDLDRALDERGSGTGAERIRHVAMAVVALAAERDEAAVRCDGTGVDRGPADRRDGGGGDEAATGGGQQVIEADRRMHARPCAGSRRV